MRLRTELSAPNQTLLKSLHSLLRRNATPKRAKYSSQLRVLVAACSSLHSAGVQPSLEILSVRERVSIFTAQSLYPKSAHHSSRRCRIKSMRSSDSCCKVSVPVLQLLSLFKLAPQMVSGVLFSPTRRFPLLCPTVLRLGYNCCRER